MNYDEMSDFEINSKVYNAVTAGSAAIILPDYCNNPSDAWPIIIENNISISPRNGKASLVGSYGACPHECEKGKELRTSMICFLEMKDAES